MAQWGFLCLVSDLNATIGLWGVIDRARHFKSGRYSKRMLGLKRSGPVTACPVGSRVLPYAVSSPFAAPDGAPYWASFILFISTRHRPLVYPIVLL